MQSKFFHHPQFLYNDILLLKIFWNFGYFFIFYELYFGCKVGDQDKNWPPHICCLTCVKLLTDWAKGSRHMYFAVPIVWREPQDHSSDCYFCLKGISSKSRHTVKYPNLPSAMRPVPHSEDLLIPHPPTHLTRGMFPPRHFCLGKEVPWTEECKNAFWLLLDDEEGCSRCQAQKEIKNPHILGKVNNVCRM